MRPLVFIATLLFVACHEKGSSGKFQVTKFIPDSTKSYYAKQFYEDYTRTRTIERLLDLATISDGSEKTELRLWNLSSSSDPQSIFILRKNRSDEWTLRVIRYYASSRDSVTSEIKMDFRNDAIAMLNVEQFWNVNSQSEMINGDSFGCMDGSTVLLELSDPSRYKYMLFRCPEIHVAKDSAFYYVSKLSADLRGLVKEE